MSLTVLTTSTRITANMTAYSAMSWPSSRAHKLHAKLVILPSHFLAPPAHEAIDESEFLRSSRRSSRFYFGFGRFREFEPEQSRLQFHNGTFRHHFR